MPALPGFAAIGIAINPMHRRKAMIQLLRNGTHLSLGEKHGQ